MKKATLIQAIALFFVTLFLYTAAAKLMDYPAAKEQLALTPILAPVAQIAVIVIPLTEIAAAVLLFFPKTRKIGFYITEALLLSFTIYIVYIINYNPELPCTCGGVLEALSWPQHLIFNSVCILLALAGILMMRKLTRILPNNSQYSRIANP